MNFNARVEEKYGHLIPKGNSFNMKKKWFSEETFNKSWNHVLNAKNPDLISLSSLAFQLNTYIKKAIVKGEDAEKEVKEKLDLIFDMAIKEQNFHVLRLLAEFYDKESQGIKVAEKSIEILAEATTLASNSGNKYELVKIGNLYFEWAKRGNKEVKEANEALDEARKLFETLNYRMK